MNHMSSNPERDRTVKAKSEARRLEELTTNPDSPLHGKIGAYVTGCRCPRCTHAASLYYRRRNANEKVATQPEPDHITSSLDAWRNRKR